MEKRNDEAGSSVQNGEGKTDDKSLKSGTGLMFAVKVAFAVELSDGRNGLQCG